MERKQRVQIILYGVGTVVLIALLVVVMMRRVAPEASALVPTPTGRDSVLTDRDSVVSFQTARDPSVRVPSVKWDIDPNEMVDVGGRRWARTPSGSTYRLIKKQPDPGFMRGLWNVRHARAGGLNRWDAARLAGWAGLMHQGYGGGIVGNTYRDNVFLKPIFNRELRIPDTFKRTPLKQ